MIARATAIATTSPRKKTIPQAGDQRLQAAQVAAIACVAALDGKAAIPAWTLSARRASSH